MTNFLSGIIIEPIIPIWLMVIICLGILLCIRKDTACVVRTILIAALLFLINLRIQIPDGTVNVIEVEKDARVLFVIDTTYSMSTLDAELAEGQEGLVDVEGHQVDYAKRLDAVKRDCKYIVDKLYGADFAIVSFDNEANVESPFTSNATYVCDLVDSLKSVDYFYAKGSNLNSAHEYMRKILEDSDDKSGKVIVFYMSDCEMTKDEELEDFSDMAGYIDGGALLCYGSDEGGNMYTAYDEYDDDYNIIGEYYEVVYDYDSDENVVSVPDEENAKSIADDMGIDCIRIKGELETSPELAKAVEDVAKSIEYKEKESTEELGYTEVYYVFVIPLLLVLIWEFVSYKRRQGYV